MRVTSLLEKLGATDPRESLRRLMSDVAERDRAAASWAGKQSGPVQAVVDHEKLQEMRAEGKLKSSSPAPRATRPDPGARTVDLPGRTESRGVKSRAKALYRRAANSKAVKAALPYARKVKTPLAMLASGVIGGGIEDALD